MAFSSEITGKLGIDTSSVPADLAKAKTAFQQFGQTVEQDAEKTGAGAGAKLTSALEHKLLGAHHLSGALAAALGLNIEHIAESIASAIVGGSKEAWKEAGDIADRETKAIEEMIELRMSPSRILGKHKKDLGRAVEEATNAGVKDEAISNFSKNRYGSVLTSIAALFGVIKSDAQILQEKEEKRAALAEKSVVVLKDEAKQRELNAKFTDDLNAVEAERLHGTDSIAAAEQRVADAKRKIVEMDSRDPKLGDAIIERKKAELALEQAIKKEKEESVTQERELAKLAQARYEAQRKLANDADELASKTGDRSKLTLGELANLSSKTTTATAAKRETYGADSGLSEEAINAKHLAQEIEDLQAKAEQLRLTGSGTEARATFDQIDTKREELVKTGFAKSTEGDQFKQLKETIHKDNVELFKIFTETNTVLKGKYVNQ